MALTGLHVACGYAGGFVAGSVVPLRGPRLWSETLASAGTTSNAAPKIDSEGRPMMTIRSSVDAWYATGSNPNASAHPKDFLPANETAEFFVNPGDKLAWVAA